MFCEERGRQAAYTTPYRGSRGRALMAAGEPPHLVPPPTDQGRRTPPAPPPGGMGRYPPPPHPGDRPPGRGRRGLWAVLALVIALLIIVAVAVPLVLASRAEDEQVAESTTSSSPTTTEAKKERPRRTTTTAAPDTTTTSSTTPPVAGPPGDSPGAWVEVKVPDVMTQAVAAVVSDEVLAVQVQTESGPGLRARLFSTGETFEIPVGDGDVGGLDVDGTTVVWWEGSYDEETSSYVDQHVYAYSLPDGPKKDMVGGSERNVGYPQLAGPWLTWVEGEPWEEAPDEYWRMPILGYLLDPQGEPVGEPNILVPSAVTSIIGDAGWSYALSRTQLAWEQAAEVDGSSPGTYVMDLGTLETRLVGSRAWRPSLSGELLVYWDDGLVLLDVASDERRQIDARGDFAAAAPTFASYFRPVEGMEAGYEIVARGYEEGYEQVLLEQAPSAPWLSAPISASATHIVFPAGGRLYLFEWQVGQGAEEQAE